MRALVTGAAGFIGSHVSEALLDRGWHVVGIDNLLTGREGNIDDRVVLRAEDIAATLPEQGFDLVVHCAASYSNPGEWRRDVETNVLGTIAATRIARASGCRLFYFQTSLPPISSYAISKIAGQKYIEASGVDHVTFRLANIYGPRNLSGPVPAFWKRLTAGETCTVVDTRRDVVFVDDLVRGVITAIDAPAVSGVVDMCSGTDYRILALWREVRRHVDANAECDLVAKGADDVDKMELSPARALAELGWCPVTPLAEGVAAACGWYAEHGVERAFTHLREPAMGAT